METLAQEDEHLKLISFSRNFGKESALYAGLSNAIGSYVAVLDADLQDPPELLAEMYSILREGQYDCVAAYRATRKGEPVLRSLFANAFYRINNRLADTRIVNGARDFRMMNRSMVNAVLSMTEANRFSKGLFSWVGFDTCWLSYENVERVEGKSKWSFFRLFRYAVEGIVNFSQAPLMIASAFGLILTVVAFVFLVLIVVRRILFGDPVDGWASLISVIIFLGGCQLFSIGILGAYLGKAYVETKRRPHYIIKRTNIHGAKKIN
jgi:glycosyltransferase involved in cell wall biosynthesis